MNKNLTEIVFILDRSGSMAGLEEDTIGGFNGMLQKQKRDKGEALVSCVLFDNVSEVILDRKPLKEVAPMTEKEYYVRGSTALIDALGGAIHHISLVHRVIREEDRPAHTVFIVITDGYENASRQYSAQQVRDMVSEKEKQGWEFLFLGANIDAVETASRYGIRADHAVDYKSDSIGTRANFEALDKAVRNVRNVGAVSADWADDIKADVKRRGRK